MLICYSVAGLQIMNLVEALEKTSSLALNFTSTTNQSILLSKENIGKIINYSY